MTPHEKGVPVPDAPDPAATAGTYRFDAMRPWLGTVLALSIWGAALVVMATTRWEGDVGGFARFSTAWRSAAEFAGLAEVPRTSYGYDGQFYAAIATDPLFLEKWPAGALDDPPYRGGRILVPLAAWLLSFGKGELAARVYVVLCWALALVAVFALDRWQRAEGGAPEWGLTLLFSAGLVASVARALPDAAALGLVVLALRAHGQGRSGRSLVFNVGAVLCRETSLLASLAMAFVDLRARRFRAGLAHLGLPVAAAGLWRLWLLMRIGSGSSDLESVQRHLGPPLGWLGDKLAAMSSQRPLGQLVDLMALGAVLLAVAAAVPLIWRWRRWQSLEATYVGFAALALVLTYPVYAEPFAYSRALIALPILGLPLAAREAGSGLSWMVRGSAILGAFSGVVLLWIDLVPAMRRLFA